MNFLRRLAVLHEEFKRRIKTQTVLPCAETAAMNFPALLASGQITMSPRPRTQMRPSSGSISMATSNRNSTSSPRSLATRSMVLTRETLLTCIGSGRERRLGLKL